MSIKRTTENGGTIPDEVKILVWKRDGGTCRHCFKELTAGVDVHYDHIIPSVQRTVPLTPAMIAVLRKHKVTQMKERMRAANVWTDTGLVFTTELGTRVEPRNILRVIETASAKAGVTEVTVHTLRHSAAVAWLEAGVHIRQVADLLGHSSVSVTGDVYGHGSEGGARAAVLALADRLNL
jgi:integrase